VNHQYTPAETAGKQHWTGSEMPGNYQCSHRYEPFTGSRFSRSGNKQYIHQNFFIVGGAPNLENPKGLQHKIHRAIYSFLKTIFMATQTKGITASKIKNEAAFERTRENQAEFSRGGKAGKLLRGIFRELLINASDKHVSSRLVREVMRVLHTDPVSARGERTVGKGDPAILEGFNFNVRNSLTDTLFVHYALTVDRPTGQVTMALPVFTPRTLVQAQPTATHFRIIAAAAAIDFDKGAYDFQQQASAQLAWDNKPADALTLQVTLPAASTNPIIVVVGVEFYQQVNTLMYPLKNGQFNAASIVKVVK